MDNDLIQEIDIISFKEKYEFNALAKNEAEGLLGKGGFGKVYLANHYITDTKYALKWAVSDSDNLKYSILDEVVISTKIPVHKNIAIYIKGYKVHDKNVGFFDAAIIQYYPDGNLEQFLSKSELGSKVKCSIANGIIDGINHLHTKDEVKICHRDLKPSNILITNNNEFDIVPKITDFGLSKIVSKLNEEGKFSKSLTGGTHYYTAPEQFDTKIEFIGFNSDLWSLGLILFELFTGTKAFEDGENDENISNKNAYLRRNMQAEKISNKINDVPEPYQEIIIKCLKYDSKDRIQSITHIKDILNGKAKADKIAILLKQINETTDFLKKIELAKELLKLEPENEIANEIIKNFLEEQVTVVLSKLVIMLNELLIKKDYQTVIKIINEQDESTKNSKEIQAKLKIAQDKLAKIETQTAIDNLIKNAIEYAEKNNFEEANNTLEEAIQKGCIDTQISDTKAKIEKYKSIYINTLLAEAKIKIDEKKVRQAKAKAKKVLLIDPNNEEAKNVLAIKQAPINLKPIYYGAVVLIFSIGIYWAVNNKPQDKQQTKTTRPEINDTIPIPIDLNKITQAPYNYKETDWYKKYIVIESKISIAEKNKNYAEVVSLAEQAKGILKSEAKSELVKVDNLIKTNKIASKVEIQNKQNQEITKPKIGSKDNLTKVELNDRIKRLEQYDLQKYIRPDDSKFIFIKSKGTNGLWGALNYKDATIGIDFIYEKVDFSESGYAIFIDKIGTKKKIKY